MLPGPALLAFLVLLGIAAAAWALLHQHDDN